MIFFWENQVRSLPYSLDRTTSAITKMPVTFWKCNPSWGLFPWNLQNVTSPSAFGDARELSRELRDKWLCSESSAAIGFRPVYSCQFCLYSRTDVQRLDATIDACQMRSTAQHDHLTQEIQENAGETYGVKGTCVFSDQLSYFHTITGFPPDVLHDLLDLWNWPFAWKVWFHWNTSPLKIYIRQLGHFLINTQTK